MCKCYTVELSSRVPISGGITQENKVYQKFVEKTNFLRLVTEAWRKLRKTTVKIQIKAQTERNDDKNASVSSEIKITWSPTIKVREKFNKTKQYFILIIENSICKVDKFQYLVSLLEGKAWRLSIYHAAFVVWKGPVYRGSWYWSPISQLFLHLINYLS